MLFDVTRDHLREGITELELTGAVDAVARKYGHAGCLRVRAFNQDLYYLHLLSGDNTQPSYFNGSVGGRGVGPAYAQGACDKLICRDEPILVDYNFVFEGYMMDQTRVFCLGQLPERLAVAHTVAVNIIRKIENEAGPGLPWGEIYHWSVEMARASGFGAHFLGFPEQEAFVGHGIGIELDELPVLGRGFAAPLEEGMIFAVEPKFVFPEGAVGLENTYVVTPNGLEKLTVYEEDVIYL
jgi:Xaa-Pro aminopeptidase